MKREMPMLGNIDQDVITIQSPIVSIANQKTTDDIAYYATRSIYEPLDELSLISPYLNDMSANDLLHDFCLPMHPGAKKISDRVGQVAVKI
jgi:TRAP-type uncharacterized transport system substrate-binding protein